MADTLVEPGEDPPSFGLGTLGQLSPSQVVKVVRHMTNER